MFCSQSISVFPVCCTSAPYPFIHLSPPLGMKKYRAPVAGRQYRRDGGEVGKNYRGQNILHIFLYISVASLFVDCTNENFSKPAQSLCN